MIHSSVLVIAVAHLVQNSNAQCCPPNEMFKECGTACEPSCKNPNPTVCTDQCIVNVCQCKEGFYRNSNNSCVDSCAAEPCGDNEQRVNASTPCEPTCNEREPGACITVIAENVCRCTKGYIREFADGPCIPTRECPPDSECGENAEYNECGSACAPSCSNPKTPRRPACLDVCVKGCQCKSGFLRDSDGKCVTKCPKKPL